MVTPGSFSIPSQKNSSVEQIVTQVTKRLKHEIQFTIFSKRSRQLPRSEVLSGIRHIRPSRKVYLDQVVASLRRIQPDLIQVENRPMIAYKLKRKFPHIPVWLSLHSTRFITSPHLSSKKVRRCLKKVDAVIVNSYFLKQFVVRLAPKVKKNTHVIYPGVETERFISRWTSQGTQLRKAKLQELGYENKKIILYAGRLLKSKGVHYVLRALSKIVSEHPDTVLLIVGSAFYGRNKRTSYVKKLHQMGSRYPKHVRFIPFVAHDQMMSWFRLADVVVVPSIGREAFGLVNIEAMACGVPVIATYNGGMKEIIQHEKNGLLLSPSTLSDALPKAINRLLNNSELRERMGRYGAQFVANQFTWGHTAERYKKLLERI